VSDGFPERPRGSAGAIEGAGERLAQAADALNEGSSTLKQTASGLSGVSWIGPAEGRFTSAAAGLSGVCAGAEDALRTCAQAARGYAQALETAQRIIEREREEYDQARAEQATAGHTIGFLSREMAMAKPDERAGFETAIGDAWARMDAAGDRAQQALVRARRAREDFDDAERKAIGELEGTAPGKASGFSAFGMPSLGTAPAPFLNSGTGGFGAGGGGFGIPMGGLAPFTGLVDRDEMDTLDPYANNWWLERTEDTTPDDLTFAITMVAAPVAPVVTAAGRAVAGKIASAGSRVFQRGKTTLATEEGRVAVYEAGGQIFGKAGVPYAEEATKLTAPLLRAGDRAYVKGVIAEAHRETAKQIAILRATRELSHGIRTRIVSKEEIDRIAREVLRAK
jgi:uncharacterized protein YukE